MPEQPAAADVRRWDPSEYGLGRGEPLGLLRTSEIQESRIGVGFETLDRRMFDPHRVLPYMRELGAKWARVQTGWCRCETVVGQYDFAWLDEIVDGLLDCGVQPWFNLGYGNTLYMPEATNAPAVGCVPLYYTPETLPAWRRFVLAIGTHFADRVQRWEIWNEPNMDCFWRPRGFEPGEYVRLVRETAPILRDAVPGAFLVGGANFCALPPVLDALLEHGLADLVDAYSFHPYRRVPEQQYAADIAGFRGVMRARGVDLPLFQGECGYPAHGEGHHDTWLSFAGMTERDQAKLATRRILSDLGQGVDFASYFHAVDLMASDYVLGDGKKHHPVLLGLIRGEDYQPRLSFHAMRSVCTLFGGQAEMSPSPVGFRPDGDPGSSESKLAYLAGVSASFRRDGYPLVAYWCPEDPRAAFAPTRVTLTYGHCGTRPMTDPVLVDPLAREVYALGERTWTEDGYVTLFGGLPYVDYPLILTDRAALPGG